MLPGRLLLRILIRQPPRCLAPQTPCLRKVLDHQRAGTSVQGEQPRCHLSTLQLTTRIDRTSSTLLNVSRNFASKKGKKGPQKSAETSDSDDSDAEKDPFEDDSDYEDLETAESSEPKAYKDITRHVPSVRLDAILKAGLDTSRHKIEEEFYANKIRVNGQKVLKKSTALKEGDVVDLILNTQTQQEGMINVSRVTLLKTEDKTTQSGNTYVQLRRWKVLAIPNPKKRPGVAEQTEL